MTDKIQGTALITGASTGLGAVYADRLARRGHDLILVARNGVQLEERATKLRTDYGVAVDVIAADLTKSDDVTRIEQRLIDDTGIALFVNNAGMSLNGGTLENGTSEIQTIIALNITAAARLAIAARKSRSRRSPTKVSGMPIRRRGWRWDRGCRAARWRGGIGPRKRLDHERRERVGCGRPGKSYNRAWGVSLWIGLSVLKTSAKWPWEHHWLFTCATTLGRSGSQAVQVCWPV